MKNKTEKHQEIQILKTEIADLDKVCWLFDDAIAFQKKNGFPEYRWDDRDAQKECILSQTHYKIVKEGEILGVFHLQNSDKFIWREMDQGQSIYLHGLLIDTKYKGERLLQVALDWIINYARKEAKKQIRLDSWADNPPLENYYKSFGFKKIEDYQLPNNNKIALNCRGNKVVLMQYDL